MRTATSKFVLALGVVSAIAAFDVSAGTAHAQGFYIDAPGIHVGVGHRHYHRYYRPGYEAYGYEPGYYGYGYRYRAGPNCYAGGCCPRGYTIQDGVCKPYRGY